MNKKISFIKTHGSQLIAGMVAVVLVLLLAGCGEETTTPTVTTVTTTPGAAVTVTVPEGGFKAELKGTDEVPPVTTEATGEAVFTLSEDGMSMTYKVNVSNITDISASHIHMAPAGSNGPIVVSLFAGPKAGQFSGTLAEGTITAANLSGPLAGKTLNDLVAEIEAGNTYVNVHTTANPNGEIRGQVK